MAKKRDQIDPTELRQQLLDLAAVVLELEERGELLEATPELIKIMGDLRSRLFEYEVRHTGRLFGQEEELPEILEAQRIVDEAARRLEDEEEQEWWRRWSMDPDEGSDS
ncbi:MAG: hypothetical protein JSV86_18015 [Gemmatimonadota bacterium]|nr:MAG: hypothetical protein JSV86_18015 [Gemmatimonadota bacterium]